MKFVIHFCKNPKCNNCWVDEDLTNAKSRPPKWKYCPDCVKQGYINPDKPLLTDLQKRKLELMNQARCNKRYA